MQCMKNHFLSHSVIFVLSLFMGACVSVNIPTSAGTPAKDVQFNEPSGPFKNLKVKTADQAWLSAKTGNTISFLSDCNASVDPTLKQMENESIAVLDKLVIKSSQQIDFNGREALQTVAHGEVDGVQVETQLVVFKKNNCNYTIIYGGLSKNYETENKQFQSFLESFRAP